MACSVEVGSPHLRSQEVHDLSLFGERHARSTKFSNVSTYANHTLPRAVFIHKQSINGNRFIRCKPRAMLSEEILLE